MNAIAQLVASLAVLVLGLAGVVSIVGARALRDRLVQAVGWSFVAAIVFPVLRNVAVDGLRDATGATNSIPEISPWLVVLVVFGHLALGIAVVRRRLRGPEHARRIDGERDRVRARGRHRLDAEPWRPS